MPLSDADFSCAWESNLRSPAHGESRKLAPEELYALRAQFEQDFEWGRLTDPSLTAAEVLYAYGTELGERRS